MIIASCVVGAWLGAIIGYYLGEWWFGKEK